MELLNLKVTDPVRELFEWLPFIFGRYTDLEHAVVIVVAAVVFVLLMLLFLLFWFITITSAAGVSVFETAWLNYL